MRGQVPGSTRGGVRTKSAINNTQTSGKGARGSVASGYRRQDPKDRPPRSSAKYDATRWHHKTKVSDVLSALGVGEYATSTRWCHGMGGSSVRTGDTCLPPQFLEANVKSLIFTIGAPLNL